MDLSSQEIRWIIQALIILILSICVHEFGHAIVADKLGDPLPRSQGRTTLNPAAHADPIGTLLFPLIGLLVSKGTSIGFGWGRPVQVSPAAFTRKLRVRTSHMLVAAAGPIMNILFGLLISVIWLVLWKTDVLTLGNETHLRIMAALQYAVILNFILAFFNLLPAPPLDGGTVLAGVLPDRAQPTYQEYAKYGFFVVLAFFMIPTLAQVFIWPARKLFELWGHGVLGLPF